MINKVHITMEYNRKLKTMEGKTLKIGVFVIFYNGKLADEMVKIMGKNILILECNQMLSGIS